MEIRDRRFVAFLVVTKGIKYEITDNKIYMNITSQQFDKYREQYKKSAIKKAFDIRRKIDFLF